MVNSRKKFNLIYVNELIYRKKKIEKKRSLNVMIFNKLHSAENRISQWLMIVLSRRLGQFNFRNSINFTCYSAAFTFVRSRSSLSTSPECGSVCMANFAIQKSIHQQISFVESTRSYKSCLIIKSCKIYKTISISG